MAHYTISKLEARAKEARACLSARSKEDLGPRVASVLEAVAQLLCAPKLATGLRVSLFQLLNRGLKAMGLVRCKVRPAVWSGV